MANDAHAQLLDERVRAAEDEIALLKEAFGALAARVGEATEVEAILRRAHSAARDG